MNILVVGEQSSLSELELRLGNKNSYDLIPNLDHASDLSDYNIIFDFVIQDYPEHYSTYAGINGPLVFLNTVTVTIAELQYTFGESNANIFGFNGLPSFVNRELFELTQLNFERKINHNIPFDYQMVQDRVGLVTPRIILMIINEAYFTVQEGTSSKEDIDTGMKLGTNYPYGPFEWVERIGLKNVYETLEAIYEDTKEERYKIAPLLKSEYLKTC